MISRLDAAIQRFSAGNYQNLKASSRTDAGVHAIRNACHVDLAARINPRSGLQDSASKILHGINYRLRGQGSQLLVRDVRLVDRSFDARFSASGRTCM